jgi:hypothetical protein
MLGVEAAMLAAVVDTQAADIARHDAHKYLAAKPTSFAALVCACGFQDYA